MWKITPIFLVDFLLWIFEYLHHIFQIFNIQSSHSQLNPGSPEAERFAVPVSLADTFIMINDKN